MSGDKAHSDARIANDAFRENYDRIYPPESQPWHTCERCGMTREDTVPTERGYACLKCDREP